YIHTNELNARELTDRYALLQFFEPVQDDTHLGEGWLGIPGSPGHDETLAVRRNVVIVQPNGVNVRTFEQEARFARAKARRGVDINNHDLGHLRRSPDEEELPSVPGPNRRAASLRRDSNFFTGAGIGLHIYFIVSRFWRNVSEPMSVGREFG